MRLALLVLAAGCWSSSSPTPTPAPRATTPVAAPQPTTPAPAAAPSEPEPEPGETVLSAKRWQYASYFNRLKRTIAGNWMPADVWKALPAVRRTAYGTADRKTVLELQLTEQGDLVRVAVVQSSGATELDAEAIRSVQVSAPFQHAPQGAPLTFKFGFYFEISAQAKSVSVAP